MKPQEFGILLLLSAIWGVSFLLIRVAAPVLGPIGLVTVRMLIASGVLLLYSRMIGQALPALRTAWRSYVTLGALNAALPLTLEAVAVVYLNASMAAVLATTTSLFTTLVAAVWLHEPWTIQKGGGILLGLIGVVMLVGWSTLPMTLPVIIAIGAAVLSSLVYAIGGVYARVRFSSTPVLTVASGQELVAGAMMLPLALAFPPMTMPDRAVIAATLILALLMTAGGNLLYFSLIRRVGPTKTQTVSYLVPIVAMLAGVLFLDEPVTAGMLVGLGSSSIGVLLVTEVRLPEFQKLQVRQHKHTRTRQPLSSAAVSPVAATYTAIPRYDRHSVRRLIEERR